MAEWLGEVKEVTAELEGRIVKGWYFVAEWVVKVRSSTGHLRSAQLGGLARHPEGVARLLLLELAKREMHKRAEAPSRFKAPCAGYVETNLPEPAAVEMSAGGRTVSAGG